VEGEGAELEGDAAEDEGHAREGERRDRAGLGLRGEGRADLREVERVGHAGNRAERAVDEDDAHEEQGGAEAARDQVFHAGLERGLAAAQVADEHVEADGGRLQREEERDEVVRLREQHERGGHDQQDVMVVGHRGVAVAQEAFGQETGQQCREQEDHAHARQREVLAEQAREGLRVRRQRPRTPAEGHDGDERQAGARGQGDQRAQPFRQEHRLQQAEQRKPGHGEFRQDGRPVGRPRGQQLEGEVDVGEERNHRAVKVSVGRGRRTGRASARCAGRRSRRRRRRG